THLLALAGADEKNLQYLGHAVRALRRHGEVEEARRLVNRMDEKARQTPEGTELTAQVLHAGGKKAEAVALLLKYFGGKEERLAPVAVLLARLGEDAAAEKLFRRLAADPKRPDGLLLLARHLGRRKQVPEALRLCDGAWGKAKDEEVAVVSLDVLRSGPATAPQRAAVGGKVCAALARRPTSVGLLLCRAGLEDGAGRYDEAIGLYRRSLAVLPGNQMALNNLSCLLALKGEMHEQALVLVEQLLEAVGPV